MRIMNMFSRKVHAKKCIAELSKIKDSADYLFHEEVYEHTKRLLLDTWEEIDKTIESGSKTHELIALIYLRKVIDGRLTSGAYHIYRGTLGIGGPELLKLYISILDRFVELGFCTEQDRADDIASMKEELRNIG